MESSDVSTLLSWIDQLEIEYNHISNAAVDFLSTGDKRPLINALMKVETTWKNRPSPIICRWSVQLEAI